MLTVRQIKLLRLIGLATLISVSFASIADDTAADEPPTNEAFSNRQISTSALLARVKQQFARTKAQGTVWLRTQKMMDELMSLSAVTGNSVEKQRMMVLAQRIAEDCRLIDNQTALERARYLLTTLKLSAVDEASLDAVRAMLSAADGEGALLLTEGLVAELNAKR